VLRKERSEEELTADATSLHGETTRALKGSLALISFQRNELLGSDPRTLVLKPARKMDVIRKASK
jgi:hypothetical protein